MNPQMQPQQPQQPQQMMAGPQVPPPGRPQGQQFAASPTVPRIEIQKFQKMLSQMPDSAVKQFMQNPQYMQNPMFGPLVNNELTRRVAMRQQAQAQQAPQGPQPTVLQQAAQAAQQLPEESGIATLPAPNMETFSAANGGIVAFAAGDLVDFDLEQEDAPMMEVGAEFLPSATLTPEQKRIRAMVRAEAIKQGVDPDFADRMAWQESKYNPSATSPRKAAGVTQIMPLTGRDLGLSEPERYVPEKNIPAGVRYLKQQLDTFGGDPAKAAAAYNWGPGALQKHLKQTGGKLDLAALPEETRNYVRFVADGIPPQQAAAAAKQVASGRPLEEVTAELDAAKESVRAADELRRGYGIRQRRADPGGYGTVMSALEQNRAEQDRLQKEYEAALLRDQPEIFGPITKPLTRETSVKTPQGGLTETPRDRELREKQEKKTAAPGILDALSRDPLEGVTPVSVEDIERRQRGAEALENMGRDPLEDVTPAGTPRPDKKDLIAEAKKVIPAEKRKGMSDEALLTFFLNLMGGQSRFFSRNLSAAGLAALQAEKGIGKEEADLAKEAREERRAEVTMEMLRKQGDYYTRDPELVRTLDALSRKPDGTIDREYGLQMLTKLKGYESRDALASRRLDAAEEARIRKEVMDDVRFVYKSAEEREAEIRKRLALAQGTVAPIESGSGKVLNYMDYIGR